MNEAHQADHAVPLKLVSTGQTDSMWVVMSADLLVHNLRKLKSLRGKPDCQDAASGVYKHKQNMSCFSPHGGTAAAPPSVRRMPCS